MTSNKVTKKEETKASEHLPVPIPIPLPKVAHNQTESSKSQLPPIPPPHLSLSLSVSALISSTPMGPHQPHPGQPQSHYLHQNPHYQHRHGRSNLASCAAAAAFLLLLVAAAAVALFILFRPHDPTIVVSAVQLPGFASANGTATFTFAQLAAVRNPNRNMLSHYDSSLVVLSRPLNQVAGFMFIPAGQIEGGRTQYMSASFNVAGFPVSGNAEVVEVESMMKLKGRVEVLKFFMHHVETTKMCTVSVSSRDGAVLGFRC